MKIIFLFCLINFTRAVFELSPKLLLGEYTVVDGLQGDARHSSVIAGSKSFHITKLLNNHTFEAETYLRIWNGTFFKLGILCVICFSGVFTCFCF